MENVFSSIHLSLLGTNRNRKSRNLANTKAARTQKCACSLEIRLQTRLCELLRCPGAESISRSFTNQRSGAQVPIQLGYQIFDLKKQTISISISFVLHIRSFFILGDVKVFQ